MLIAHADVATPCAHARTGACPDATQASTAASLFDLFQVFVLLRWFCGKEERVLFPSCADLQVVVTSVEILSCA